MGRIVSTQEVLDYADLQLAGRKGQAFEDVLIQVEALVERWTGRRFSPDPEFAADGTDTLPAVTKSFTVMPGQVVVRIPDLRDMTSITYAGLPMYAAGTGLGTYGYRLDEGGDTFRRIYLVGSFSMLSTGALANKIAITGRWGYYPPPEEIKLAVKFLTMRSWREREAAWADSIANPDGSVLSYFREMPASVQGTLRMFRDGPKVGVI